MIQREWILKNAMKILKTTIISTQSDDGDKNI